MNHELVTTRDNDGRVPKRAMKKAKERHYIWLVWA